MSKENIQAQFSQGLALVNSKVASWLGEKSEGSVKSEGDDSFLNQPIIRQGSGLNFSSQAQDVSTVADFIMGKEVKRERRKPQRESRSLSMLEKKIQKQKPKQKPQQRQQRIQQRLQQDDSSDDEDKPIRSVKKGSNLLFEKQINKTR